MKNRKSKILYGFLIFLIAACAPQPGAVHPSKVLFSTRNQCKAMVRKQRQLARNAGSSKKRKHESKFFATSRSGSAGNTAIPYAPERSAYFQASLTESVSVPEMPAFIPEGSPRNITSRKPENFSPVFPTKTLPETTLIPNKNLAPKKPVTRENNPEISRFNNDQKYAVRTTVSQPKTAERNIALWFGLTGLLTAGMLAALHQKVKQLSEWASRNLGKARGLLAFIRIFTALAALAAGNYLAQQGIWVSETERDAAVAVFSAAALLYPVRNSWLRLFQAGYFRHKLHDIALFTTGTLMMVYAGNHFDLTTQAAVPEQTVFSFPAFSPELNTLSLVKKTVSAPADDPDDPDETKPKSTSAKILLTVLAAAVFFFLSLLLAALACSIACAGFGGLALLVFFAGETGFIFLLVLLLKKIFRKNKPAAPVPAGEVQP